MATSQELQPSATLDLKQVYEPYHTLVYFAPEVRQAFKDLGMKGYWMGYFASRAAPMGQVPAEVVIATFYNFAPGMVRRAIPEAWQLAAPEQILAARLEAADAALRRLLGELAESAAMSKAAELARQAAAGGELAGRALFAGHAALPWPRQAHLALWHATTLLREYRGDGHISALMAEGLDGLESHIAFTASAAVPRFRGFSDEEWVAAERRLAARGWPNPDATLTAAGQAGRQRVERRTDELALAPWQRLGAAGCARLRELVQPLSQRVIDQDGLTIPNDMMVAWP